MKKQEHAATALLTAQTRTKLGSRASNALRSQGRIPASIEWLGAQPHLDLAIDEEAFLTSRRRHQHVYEVDVAGTKETAIVRHLDWDVFGERIVHIEFRRVDLTKKTEVEVTLVFVGHPKGVLNSLVTHVTVSALPTEIPDNLEVSVADLEPGTTVTASQIKVPKNVDLLTPGNVSVARIVEVKIEILETPAATPAEGVTVEGATAAAPGAAGTAPAAGAPAAKGGAPGAPGTKGGAPAPEPKKGDDKKK